ncbi:redoxin domain-containing protein [bacterium]|nr:redoxin domain-containing protein [bacterium]
MISIGDTAPSFTLLTAHNPPDGAPLRPVSLDALLAEGPVVLAFFPAAFTGVCEKEMCTFRDNFKALGSANASVVGISSDLPFAQKAFADQNALPFPLLSDLGGKVATSFSVAYDDFIGLSGIAKRSVFVLNTKGVVTYTWVTDDAGVEPPYDEVIEAAESA